MSPYESDLTIGVVMSVFSLLAFCLALVGARMAYEADGLFAFIFFLLDVMLWCVFLGVTLLAVLGFVGMLTT